MNAFQTKGLIAAAILFVICFLVVHGVKLALVGLRSLRKKAPEEPPKAEEKTPEPIYYLVERKKKRSKKEYSEPKRIDFR